MKESRLTQLQAAASSGDWGTALRLAVKSKASTLGEYREAIERAWAATRSPQLYREMGKDPAELVRAGVAALRLAFGLP